MKKKDASFWSDIKILDERLSREPDSFCFARLSEIYLKVGLVADALHTARTGVAKHPGYLAGQRALAMACNASDLHDESREILERITAAMPEDVDAQKTLARMYVATGDTSSALRTYRTVLDFRPDDRASLAELELLQNSDYTPTVSYTKSEEFTEKEEVVAVSSVSGEVIAEHHDPLSTLTLAELYEKQGFTSKALAIYRSILADDPTNSVLVAKIAQLEGEEPVSEIIPEESADIGFEEEPGLPEPESFEGFPALLESQSESYVDSTEPELPTATVYENDFTTSEVNLFEPSSENIVDTVEPEMPAAEVQLDVPAQLEPSVFAPLTHKSADNVVDTLDGWLENIRRIKACR